MKKGLYYIGFGFLLLSVLFSVYACKDKPAGQPGEIAVPVAQVPVKTGNLAVPVFTSGRLYPGTLVKLSFKVGGIIKQMTVNEGDNIEKGGLLASLDLSEINARFKQAQNGFAKAQRDLLRVENLYNDRAATLEQMQDVRTAFEVAQADLKIARFNLDHAKITAPFQGKILKKLAEGNEMVGPGVPVFLFGSTRELWIVRTGVSERDIVRLSIGDRALVSFDAHGDLTFPAVISEISQSLDPASGTYEVELALSRESADEHKLMSGFVARARIEPNVKEKFYVIPLEALVEGEGQRASVFTVKNERAVKKEIVIGHIFPNMLAVRSGLKAGDVVVTSGAAYLRDGVLVKVEDK